MGGSTGGFVFVMMCKYHYLYCLLHRYLNIYGIAVCAMIGVCYIKKRKRIVLFEDSDDSDEDQEEESRKQKLARLKEKHPHLHATVYDDFIDFLGMLCGSKSKQKDHKEIAVSGNLDDVEKDPLDKILELSPRIKKKKTISVRALSKGSLNSWHDITVENNQKEEMSESCLLIDQNAKECVGDEVSLKNTSEEQEDESKIEMKVDMNEEIYIQDKQQEALDQIESSDSSGNNNPSAQPHDTEIFSSDSISVIDKNEEIENSNCDLFAEEKDEDSLVYDRFKPGIDAGLILKLLFII